MLVENTNRKKLRIVLPAPVRISVHIHAYKLLPFIRCQVNYPMVKKKKTKNPNSCVCTDL